MSSTRAPLGGSASRTFHLKSSGPWDYALRKYWSEKKVTGEALYVPGLEEGSQDTSLISTKSEDHYPLLWRVVKLDDYQCSLKNMCSVSRTWGFTIS